MFRPDHWAQQLRFLGQEITDDEFLASAPRSNPFEFTWRWYLIGCKRLGVGDKAGAREAFENVVKHRVFVSGGH